MIVVNNYLPTLLHIIINIVYIIQFAHPPDFQQRKIF